jgi:hypothetical protein
MSKPQAPTVGFITHHPKTVPDLVCPVRLADERGRMDRLFNGKCDLVVVHNCPHPWIEVAKLRAKQTTTPLVISEISGWRMIGRVRDKVGIDLTPWFRRKFWSGPIGQMIYAQMISNGARGVKERAKVAKSILAEYGISKDAFTRKALESAWGRALRSVAPPNGAGLVAPQPAAIAPQPTEPAPAAWNPEPGGTPEDQREFRAALKDFLARWNVAKLDVERDGDVVMANNVVRRIEWREAWVD